MMHAKPERPVPFQGDLHNLPHALAPLKALPNWVCWRYELRKGKWTKPPLQPKNPTCYAKNNDPSTWGTYEQALAVFEAGKCGGIGFNLSGTDIAAFDIDKCRDPATGAIAPKAMAIVDRATSYTEMTPSGTGLRVVGYGAGAKMHRKQKLPSSTVEIESYRGAERYITITGNPLPQAWPHLADIDGMIDAVVAELDGAKNESAQAPRRFADRLWDHFVGQDKAQQDLDGEFAAEPQNATAGSASADDYTGDAFLPGDLIQLIDKGVAPQDDRSVAFHHAVCSLGDLGWTAERIERRIAGKPIVPERFAKRLRGEIDRCLRKAETKANEEESATAAEIEIARLAKLPLLEYEQQRKAAAERLDVRASVLDLLVRAERERLGLDGGGDGRRLQGRAVELPEPKPSEEPVNGASLLDEIVKAIKTYIVLSEHAARSCAVWTVYTFLAEHFLVSPRLCISSPVMGCGKSTLTDIISRLVLRPLKASNATAAAIFRVVEMHKPCLLIDEGDTFVELSEELRGILNSGHRHDGAVLRVVGEDLEPRLFATFSPCSVALIGELPPTLADRSILVGLKRRRPADGDVTSFSLDEVGHLDLLARQSARWAQDHAVDIAATKPEMPDGIINRARDNWRVLKAIATVAGGEWPSHIDDAALAAQARTGEETSQLEQLLSDIKAVAFLAEGDDEVRSADLVQRLVELEGRPWAEMGKGEKALTQNRLARMLKPLGIGPGYIGPKDDRARGYRREQFNEAFERYLANSKCAGVQNVDKPGTSSISEVCTPDDGCTVGKSKKPNNDGLLHGCTVATGEFGEVRIRHPHVTFLGVEPFAPCERCGKADGVVHHVRDNRHLGCSSVNLHEGCAAEWFAGLRSFENGPINSAGIDDDFG